jgi:hypothetical protein
MTLILHLIKSFFGAFFKVTLTGLFLGAAAAGATLLVAYLNGHVWPPRTLTEVAAGAFGVLAAYAGGLTMLMREAVRAALAVERGVVKGIEQEAEGIEREVVVTRR